jgi:hypothetical protein
VGGLSTSERAAIFAYVNLDMLGSINGVPLVTKQGELLIAEPRREPLMPPGSSWARRAPAIALLLMLSTA